jgi:hypothetical protein
MRTLQIMNEVYRRFHSAINNNNDHFYKDDFHKYLHDLFWKELKEILTEDEWKKFIFIQTGMSVKVSVLGPKISIYFEDEKQKSYSIKELIELIK